MTIEARLRTTVRESKIWVPFLYSYPFDVSQGLERVTIYGLYAGSYLNLHDYLTEIETVELANMLTDYNEKIAELTTDEQILVATIVSKRYVAGIDKLIHDDKLVTKLADNTAKDAVWTAKIEALSVDRAVLDTLVEKVATETIKTAAKISELEAYIEIE